MSCCYNNSFFNGKDRRQDVRKMSCCYNNIVVWTYLFFGCALGGYLISFDLVATPAENALDVVKENEDVFHFYEFLMWITFAAHTIFGFCSNLASCNFVNGMKSSLFTHLLFPLSFLYLILVYSNNLEFAHKDAASVELVNQLSVCLANYRHHVLAFYVLYNLISGSFATNSEDYVPRLAAVTAIVAILQHFFFDTMNSNTVVSCTIGFLLWSLLSYYILGHCKSNKCCCFASCKKECEEGENNPEETVDNGSTDEVPTQPASPPTSSATDTNIFSDDEDDERDDQDISENIELPKSTVSSIEMDVEEGSAQQKIYLPVREKKEGEGEEGDAKEDGEELVIPSNRYQQQSPIDERKIPRNLHLEGAGPKSPVGITQSRLRPRRSGGRQNQ
eukprot:m.7411 g.7411  ORF g.7411 m.7411 type:complete len:390 (+) comp2796_c0_seq1:3-1172(+)